MNDETQPKPKQFAQNENHKTKNFAYLASQRNLRKNNGEQTKLAQAPQNKPTKRKCKLTWLKK
ncbi:MAG: hypothetical protein IPM31_13795 [Anaerolineae bacterium]|nr:hypothetical protein [Anaerolineae bacterium]